MVLKFYMRKFFREEMFEWFDGKFNTIETITKNAINTPKVLENVKDQIKSVGESSVVGFIQLLVNKIKDQIIDPRVDSDLATSYSKLLMEMRVDIEEFISKQTCMISLTTIKLNDVRAE